MQPHELREARDSARLSQAMLSERLGITPRHYRRLESGVTPISKHMQIAIMSILQSMDKPENLGQANE